MKARVYYGTAAHFIAGESCRFHIATEIGDVLVSTVGDCRIGDTKEPIEIGYGRLYETMAFRLTGDRCKCGCGLPLLDGREIDFAGYNTAGEANAGHEDMCRKYESADLSAEVDV